MSEEIPQPVLSPSQIFSNWLKDGNLRSPYPKELESNNAISQIVFLYYFESSTKYFPFINKLFNNFSLFSIPAKELCILLKEMIYFTGFKQPFFQKTKKAADNKLVDILRKRYPFFKKEEILMLVDFIDKSEDKDIIYEMLNLYSPKAKKLTPKEKKEQKKKIENMLSKDSLLDLL